MRLLIGLILALPLLAQQPDLSGTWVGKENGAQKLWVDQKADKIHIKKMNGDKVEADFTCSLSGQECSAKEDGHSEKIMMYFNGPKLVEICERGSATIKDRLAVSADGKTLTIETVPLSSDQRTETVSFVKEMN